MNNQEIYKKATGKPFEKIYKGLTDQDIESLKNLLLTLSADEQVNFILYITDEHYTLAPDFDNELKSPERRAMKKHMEQHPNWLPPKELADEVEPKNKSFEKFLGLPDWQKMRTEIFQEDDDA